MDVACGTGTHAGLLSKLYKIEGMDVDPQMIAIARNKHKKIRFFQGDMLNFTLNRRFDAITCLFSSIGYVKTKVNLVKAVRSMASHLKDGGVLLVEPWFTTEQWMVGRVNTLHVNEPDLNVTRMSFSRKRGTTAIVEFHYLVGTRTGIEYFTEFHELGLFSHNEYLDAFRSAGLKIFYNRKGLDGRGLYIGRKVK